MRRYSLTYLIGQSFKGLWRNGVMSVASILVLLSCLIVMGTFGLIIYNLNDNLASLGDLNSITVFIDMEKTDEEIQSIGESISRLSNVKNVEYISKAEAFERQKAIYEEEYPYFFQGVDETIYPASYVITCDDNAHFEELRLELEKMKDQGVSKVRYLADAAETLESIKNGVIYIFTWFMAILFFVSLFVIINTIKLAVSYRKQEISIMRYVGATNWFIMLPFIFEGILIGIISSVSAFFIQMYLYGFIESSFLAEYNIRLVHILPFDNVKYIVLGAFLAIGIFTGIVGSSISLRKNLKA